MDTLAHQFDTLHNPDETDFHTREILLNASLLQTPHAQAQQIEIELIKIRRISGDSSISTLLLRDSDPEIHDE